MQKTPRIVNLQRHELWEKTTVALTQVCRVLLDYNQPSPTVMSEKMDKYINLTEATWDNLRKKKHTKALTQKHHR